MNTFETFSGSEDKKEAETAEAAGSTAEAPKNPHIMVSLETWQDFNSAKKEAAQQGSENAYGLANATIVDQFDRRTDFEERGFLNGGYNTYVISPLDETNKSSREYIECTGLAAVGADKETGKNISFLTHQNPGKCLDALRENFTFDLKARMKEIEARSMPGTVDVIIFGGDTGDGDSDYKEMVGLLEELVEDTLHIKPERINGPKTAGEDAMFFDTSNRRGHFIRSKINPDI